MALTNPPFMRERGALPFHLRPTPPEELEQHRRMVREHERLHRRPADRGDRHAGR